MAKMMLMNTFFVYMVAYLSYQTVDSSDNHKYYHFKQSAGKLYSTTKGERANVIAVKHCIDTEDRFS